MIYRKSNVVMVNGFTFVNNANVRQQVQHKQQLNQRSQKQNNGQNLQSYNNAVQELCSMYDAVNYFGNDEYARKNGWRVINKQQLNTAIRYAPVIPKGSSSRKQQQRKQPVQQQQQQYRKQQPNKGQNQQSYNDAVQELCSMYDAVNYYGKAEYANTNGWKIIDNKQLNNASICAMRNAPVIPRRNVSRKQQQREQPVQQQQYRKQQSNRGQNQQSYNDAVQELCSMYEAVNYYGKTEYANTNGWRIIDNKQINTASICSMRNAPVIPWRNASRKQQQREQPVQQQQYRKQSRQQNNRRQSGRNSGNCQFKPNVPRVYNYNTTPLPNSLYPSTNNYNHLYEAFNYFGNPQVRNVKSWIESSRTHKLSSIATVFAKRNAPYVPVRQNRSNKRNQQQQQQQQKRQQQLQRPQQQKNVPRQQSNKRQKKQMINQQPLSNVWEEYYSSPRHSLFK